MSTNVVVAVVLAGADERDAVARAYGVESKALVPVRGRPLGLITVAALRGAEDVDEVIWVGPADVDVRERVDAVIPAGRRLVDSVALGLGVAAARGATHALLATADIPWMTSQEVERFVASARNERVIAYPVIDRVAYEAVFPGSKRTWVRLVDGDVTGGNVVFGTVDDLIASLPWIAMATEDRKVPWRLARRVGIGTLLETLMGRASADTISRRISDAIGMNVKAVRTTDVGLGTDVDHPSHLEALLEALPTVPTS